ncbi:hypothetical protein SAMN04487981_13136 [Streptomyces sp. cf386]|uniref:putative T7SS-secreted protein n=1 Tax=Streptomyces sp. cf386 TaxID=1761904 RepID=UPI00088198A3|nr:hypothetical protein [Streptomyces sp. cf386]SDP65420.1 hypothetical protein SAMN04487981_13136 [Streptomyces sp. cf386]
MSGAQDFPAIGFNPAPGKVESVNDLVTKLNSALSGLDSAHEILRSLRGEGGGRAWEGEAAKAFTGKVGDLPKYVGDSRDAIRSASTQLKSWHGMLTHYQSKARQYESDATEAKQREKTLRRDYDSATNAYNQAAEDPAFRLSGMSFSDPTALRDAQAKIDAANARLKQAGETLDSAKGKLEGAIDEFEAIVKHAKELLEEHQSDARKIAGQIKKATDGAPDPGFWEGLADAFTRLGHKIQNWCTKHADLLKKIGDWMSMAATAMGVLSLLTLWCPPLSGAFALAGGALSLGALATHGAAKIGGANISTMDLVGDAVGVVPLGKLATTATAGVKVAMKTAKNGVQMIDRARKIEALSEAGYNTARLQGRSLFGLGRQYAEGSTKFTTSGMGNRLKMAWDNHVLDTMGASVKERALSKVVEWGPESLQNSLKSAIRADGTLDPMSWWSRGTQIAGQAPGIGLGLYNAFTGSNTPAAGSL